MDTVRGSIDRPPYVPYLRVQTIRTVSYPYPRISEGKTTEEQVVAFS